MIDEALPLLLSGLGDGSFLDPADASYGGAAIGFDGSGFGCSSVAPDRCARARAGTDGRLRLGPAGRRAAAALAEVDTQASFGMAQTAIRGVSGASSFAVASPGSTTASGMIGFPFHPRHARSRDRRGRRRHRRRAAFVVLAGGARTKIPDRQRRRRWYRDPRCGCVRRRTQVEVNVAPPALHVESATLDGALLTPLGLTYVPPAATTTTTGGTVVASDGPEFLVVWSAASTQDGTSTNEIRAIRYRPRERGVSRRDTGGGFAVRGWRRREEPEGESHSPLARTSSHGSRPAPFAAPGSRRTARPRHRS